MKKPFRKKFPNERFTSLDSHQEAYRKAFGGIVTGI